MATFLKIFLFTICFISKSVIKCENIVICEDQFYSINCGCNKYISITSAKWGRDNQDTCKYHLLGCTSMRDKTSTIRSWCHGKQACFVSASEYQFGSPCAFISGIWLYYMRITYHCYIKNECDSNPCQKGTCKDGIDDYTCICYPGYYGTNCQYEIDECQSNPCVHGNCTDNINSNQCDCELGYTGVNCRIDIDECQSNPCMDGNCINNVNSYKCLCNPGYNGTHCEYEIDECLSSPCVHGTCISLVNKYECRCSWDAFGVNCEYSVLDYTLPTIVVVGIVLVILILSILYVTTKVRKIDDDIEDNKMAYIMRHYNQPDRDQAKLMFEVKNLHLQKRCKKKAKLECKFHI